MIKRRFGELESPTGRQGRMDPEIEPAKPRQTFLKRPIEQAHFCLGVTGPDRLSPDRYAFGLMNMVLGGGMSSRLFQEIREKRGLAYSIGSFAQLFSDRGFLAVSGGTGSNSLGEVLKITMDEIARICQEDVSEHEMVLAREQVIDAMLMSMENTESRMSRMAELMLAYGRVIPVDEVVQRIRQVGPEEVRTVANRYFRSDGGFAMSMVGPKNSHSPIKGSVGIAL